jgi:hypothetical protein
LETDTLHPNWLAGGSRRKASEEATILLFFIVGVQLLFGGILVVFYRQVTADPILDEISMNLAVLEWITITGLFAGLGLWSLHQPLAAATTGLV